MRCAVVKDGVVVNVIIADDPEAFEAVPAPDHVNIGDLWDGSEFKRQEEKSL